MQILEIKRLTILIYAYSTPYLSIMCIFPFDISSICTHVAVNLLHVVPSCMALLFFTLVQIGQQCDYELR